MKDEMRILFASVVSAAILGIIFKSFGLGEFFARYPIVIDLILAVAMLAVVTVINQQRTKEILAVGVSPEYLIRPVKAFQYWVVLMLAGVGIIALASEMRESHSLNLDALSLYPFLAMGFSIYITAYANPKP